MAETLSITKNDLSEIEQTIYEELKKLKDPNSALNQKLQELKSLFNQYSSLESTGKYHANRFNMLEEIATSEYRILQREKIGQQQKAVIDKMYELSIEITNELMHRDGPLDYAIYFIKDGKVYRTKQNSIELNELNISKSNQSLRISASAFKKKVLEQDQAIDITKHYNTFLTVLKDSYNGDSDIPNSIVNAGIIAEAFERHLHNVHQGALDSGGEIGIEEGYDWSVDEAWRLIRQSKGNDPWYTGGDVGMTQVKNIGKGNVRLTQFNTIEDIVNFLLYLGKEQYEDKILLKQAKETFQILYNETNDETNNFVNMTAEEIIESLFSKNKR